MRGGRRPGKGGLGVVALVGIFGAYAACAAPEEEEAPQETVEEAVEETEPAALPARRRRTTPVVAVIPGDFAHDAHGEVACTACHAGIRGHDTHRDVTCADCHAAPDDVARAPPGREECNACHHRADRTVCAQCHTDPPAASRSLQAVFVIGAGNRTYTRPIDFDHRRHADVACRDCHTGGSALAVERECRSCHDEHHGMSADCASCHPPIPLDTHDVDAHRGCGGAGCHQGTDWAVVPTRPACLVCHREQVDHEPADACTECHRLSGGGAP